MKKLFNKIYRKRVYFVMSEHMVTKCIKHLPTSKYKTNISVNNCGWKDDDKWFINVDLTSDELEAFRNSFNVVIILYVNETPESKTDNVYMVIKD